MQTDGFIDAFVAIKAASIGRITSADVRRVLIDAGLDLAKDARLRELNSQLADGPAANELDLQRFSQIMSGDGGLLAMKGLCGDLIVPDFAAFSNRVERIFHRVAEVDPVGAPIAPPRDAPLLSVFDETYPAAHNADYIPALSSAEDGWAVSICTIDGQRIDLGDRDRRFSIQSCCKPINYCQAMETFNRYGDDLPLDSRESDSEKRERLRSRAEARKANCFEHHERIEQGLGVHDFIDCEPSGQAFNAFSFNKRSMPFNPMINAGAIMCASLVSRGGPTDIELGRIQTAWQRLAGVSSMPLPDTTTAKGESRTGANNRSIAYKLFANEAFPAYIRSDQEVENVLDFYFHCCSLMLEPSEMAAAAATLASRGICSTTGERVFAAPVVKQCLASMLHCGLYDSSGRFGRIVGLPAKSGVGGGIMLVIPGVMGICTFSPRLDKVGNSLRGLRFIEALLEDYALHMLDFSSEISSHRKLVTVPEVRSLAQPAQLAISAAEFGDVTAFQRFERIADDDVALKKFLDTADYDGRRPVHLAACNGHLPVIKHLVSKGADPLPQDRWGATPLDDAKRVGNEEIIEYYAQHHPPTPDQPLNAAFNSALMSAADLVFARSEFMPSEHPHRTSAIEDLELIWAAARGDIGQLRRAAARGARLLIADYDDRTPLHLACAEAQEQAVRFLTEYFREVEQRQRESTIESRLGSYLSWPDRWGRTPLAEANAAFAQTNSEAAAECVRILVEAGAVESVASGIKPTPAAT